MSTYALEGGINSVIGQNTTAIIYFDQDNLTQLEPILVINVNGDQAYHENGQLIQ
ncbi:MAG: hypothetical protein JKX76_02615 [Colwellia sp.]|nr:hypothetical protein [Colwellia sp.]